MVLRVLCLGAGQDVGKSCVVVSFEGGVNIMFDCGIHMGYSDERRFPDFSLLSTAHDMKIDCLLITHLYGANIYICKSIHYIVLAFHVHL